MEKLMFPLLTVGLDKYLRQETAYPFPAELQYALNMLTIKMIPSFPTTFREFLTRLEEPIENWYPDDDLPAGLDSRFGILSNGSLHEITEEYLIEADLRGIVDVEGLISQQENALMADLWRQARTEYEQAQSDDEALEIEQKYTTARLFIAQHGFSTAREIRQHIYSVDQHERIQNMFMVVQDAPEQFLHPNGLGENVCWTCPACGPLYVVDGQRISAKPADCRSKCPGANGWQQVPFFGDLRVLKRGVHRRTLIPGLAEIDLFDWLKHKQRSHSELIAEVRLYPGVDAYDIRLVFSEAAGGEHWAIDVKDYRQPDALAFHLSRHSFYSGRDPLLMYDHACYVVPNYRLEDNPRYLADLRRLAPSLSIYSIREFQAMVEDKLWRVS